MKKNTAFAGSSLKKVFQNRSYERDITLLKIYGFGDFKKIKLIRLNYLKNSGLESDDFFDNSSIRGTVNSSKLEESIARSKNKIFELAFCNPWEWFFTGTINPNKQDRTDLDLYHKQLTQWIRDYNKKYGLKIKFLFVPELHSDGKSWHIHGFLSGLPETHLIQFKIGDRMGKGLAEKVLKGDKVYNWKPYFERFGFCDLEPVKNHEAVSKYVTKYINKDLYKNVTKLNAHVYYHSRGLSCSETIKKGFMNWSDINPDYENDYCSVSWLDIKYFDDLLNRFY